MSTFNISSTINKEELNDSLYKNLERSFGKSIALQAGLKTNKISIQKNYTNTLNEVTLDAIIYSNSISNKNIIGFLVLQNNSFVASMPKIIEALKVCNRLYLVTDLKDRNKLYDILDSNDLDEIGVVGRMSDRQFVLCKTASAQDIDNTIYSDLFDSKEPVINERKPLVSIENVKASFMS